MTRRAVLLAAGLLALGCAREVEPRLPVMPMPAPAWPAYPAFVASRAMSPVDVPGTATPVPPLLGPPATYATPQAYPAPTAPAKLSSAAIPDGDACLAELDRLGVRYTRMDQVRGVQTPVTVRGPIGGVLFHALDKIELVADCRLVVALDWIAPVLESEGVTEARFSGAYSYRMSRVGRLSLHAYGLAMDVHEMTVAGQRLSVEHDFARAVPDGCAPGSPPLDRVACRLKGLGLFRELLTPDSNADHYNHFHFGILPTGKTLAALPRAPKPKPKAAPHKAKPLLVEEDEGIQLLEEPTPAVPELAPPRHSGAQRGEVPAGGPATKQKADARRRPVKPHRRAQSKRDRAERHRGSTSRF